jgi:hypothetical protein
MVLAFILAGAVFKDETRGKGGKSIFKKTIF